MFGERQDFPTLLELPAAQAVECLKIATLITNLVHDVQMVPLVYPRLGMARLYPGYTREDTAHHYRLYAWRERILVRAIDQYDLGAYIDRIQQAHHMFTGYLVLEGIYTLGLG